MNCTDAGLVKTLPVVMPELFIYGILFFKFIQAFAYAFLHFCRSFARKSYCQYFFWLHSLLRIFYALGKNVDETLNKHSSFAAARTGRYGDVAVKSINSRCLIFCKIKHLRLHLRCFFR